MASGSTRKLAILWALYFVQGLPYGFQATALPAYLRDAGMSLTGIGIASALSLPWMLKIGWAPLVDRYGSNRVGRRRSWILPLQLALVVTCAAAALTPPDRTLGLLLGLVLMMNLWAATLDVAVDGLAIDLLETSELGKGNIAQVVGFKIGMLTGGGLLVFASGTIGWRGLFLSMAALVLLVFLGTLAYREREALTAASRAAVETQLSFGDIVRLLGRSLMHPGSAWLIAFIGTYKLGESLADQMFTPFLIDVGFAPPQIGLWVGTWGMLFSIAGSVGGGLLASRVPLLKAVAITAALRVVPLAGQWWLSTVVAPSETQVVVVTCAEHLFGGALTTALFAFMMSKVDRRIGATHYTLLAAVEVWGKAPARMVSGALAEATSYPVLFAMATILSAAFLLLLVPLSRYPGRTIGGLASRRRAGK